MAEPFVLDPRLAADCALVGDLPLCRLLLMDDASYPWCILVPRRAGVRELHELAATDRASLLDEVVRLSGAMQRLFAADKMNVAALGNVVPQLHVHVIARRRGDTAWPRPVWGAAPAVPYAAGARADLLARLREALAPLA
ncbi:MAG: HIT domain-containing protein [Gammaproteobacteria bacterium]|jgi:diadenosine tetraphosphate (Ap4A) HIT family hydrolase|nr:HIT domain-containing protein [Gammaproteobacteria bacterium]